jgi:hypothetical protein
MLLPVRRVSWLSILLEPHILKSSFFQSVRVLTHHQICSSQYSTTSVKMSETPSKFVLDLPLGGTVPFERVFGEGDAGAGKKPAPENSEPVWPIIPLQYELPPVHLEQTIKEGVIWPIRVQLD